MGIRGKSGRATPAAGMPLAPAAEGATGKDLPRGAAGQVPVTGQRSEPALPRRPGSYERVVRLTAIALGRPLACVTIVGRDHYSEPAWGATRPSLGPPGPAEQSLRQHVIDSGHELIIDDIATGMPAALRRSGATAAMKAWAGFPVRDLDGQVAGALCAADPQPRPWTSLELRVLADMAQLAATEVALRKALKLGSDRALLARTLQQILLPPRLAEIPGLEVAARYKAGGTGTEVLGDFYDVFPSVRGSWGLVVGDVCGHGIGAAKSTALARYTLRGEALRQAKPSLILASLNQAMLDWRADDQRFLTAIYATVRPHLAATSVRISSAGHPLALIRRADGQVHQVGRPGTLLGLFPDPELHDTRHVLRSGDSMILYTDGVTEARSHVNREFFGETRLMELIARLDNLAAGRTAAAIIKAARSHSGGVVTDDTAVLVLKVP
jgi:serine phosphatase RsbU (regulator of sigma subunit)